MMAPGWRLFVLGPAGRPMPCERALPGGPALRAGPAGRPGPLFSRCGRPGYFSTKLLRAGEDALDV
jgi:hypothetical protein